MQLGQKNVKTTKASYAMGIVVTNTIHSGRRTQNLKQIERLQKRALWKQLFGFQ